MNKLAELHHVLHAGKYDCILITETWLNENIANGLLDPQSHYNIVRKDRSGGRGGGVCALVRKCYDIVPINAHEKFSKLDVLGFDLLHYQPTVRIILIYRPPYYDITAELYAQLLLNYLLEYSDGGKAHLIVGDFNLPYINWNHGISVGHQLNKQFIDYFTDFGYNQLVNFPTRFGNMLDLIFTDNDYLVSQITDAPALGNSDHDVVEFTVSVMPAKQAKTTTCNRKQYRWYDADYDSIENSILCIDWNSVLCYNPSPSQLWNTFRKIIQLLIDSYVPLYRARKLPSSSSRVTQCHEVHKCELTKRRLWRKLKSNPYNSLVRGKYRDAVFAWRNLVTRMEMLQEERIIEANNLGAFYKFVNARLSNRMSVGAIVDGDGSIITNDKDRADIFNQYFASVATIDNGVLPPCNDVNLISLLENITVSESDIARSLKTMKCNLSAGPDGIPPLFFKRLKDCMCRPLALIFTQLLSVGYVPPDWLKAVIVPVFKKGISGTVTNYRPISLTCVLSKILEKIVSGKIYDHLITNNILNADQHGFLRRKSTTTNLLESLNDWTLYLQAGEQTVVVYVDFKKAFDSVSHNKLFIRLMSYGIRGSVMTWLQNFFCGRTHQTRIGQSLSDVEDMLSGIVQGSGVGPLMFVIYINELIEILQRHGVHVKLFADDVKLYLNVTSVSCVYVMQNAIDSLHEWAELWQLSVSVEKCSILSIGKQIVDPSFSIANNVLPVNTMCRDLGVLIQSDLKPSSHIHEIVSKAQKRTNCILRSFMSRDVNLLLRAYTVYVRPLLEYNTVVWSPCLIQDIEAVERVQRKFTKRLPGLYNYSSVDRLKRLELQSLELRRLHLDLIWCYKVVFECVNVNMSDPPQLNSYTRTRGHQYKLYKPLSSHSSRATFFSQRVINVWNALPDKVDFTSLKKFKQSILHVDFNDHLLCFKC